MTPHTYPVGAAPSLPSAPAGGWSNTGQPPSFQPPRGPRQVGMWILAVVAAVCSVAALVLGGLALSKVSQVQSTLPAPPPTVTASAAAPQLFADAADRALCQAIPDLMRERNNADNAYQALPAGSAERRAAMPAYKAGVQDWAGRMETILASHAQPDRYLTRTLQRYIDDMLLYAQNIYPNKASDPFDKPTWDIGVVDYGGALGRCNQLGIGWQR
ncbi:hypothetical protein [Mycobacterium haemophilum]